LMGAQRGAMVKRLHSGHAAQSGVLAARLAAEGFTGTPDVLEQPFGGFCSTMGGGDVHLDRLTADLLASREGLRISRARLLEATDDERRRIARDLHDGLQTRLVILAMQAGRPGAGEDDVAGLSAGLQEAIVELRELVQGVVPATLTERGLYAAAEELTDRMPMPVAVEFDQAGGELPIGVETAGYFVVSEAFSNAIKHSRAEEMRLSIGRLNGSLRIEIADDGVGGARLGSGLRGLADRVDALNGQLRIDSPPGGGTRVLVEVPCA